jgi:signal transduction histidine kinase/CheY-like chemotaxis protein
MLIDVLLVAICFIFLGDWGFAQNDTSCSKVQSIVDSAGYAKSPQLRMKLALKSYNLAQSCGDKKLVADATKAVALAHFRLNNYRAAEDSLQKAFIIYKLINDSLGIAETYYSLGVCNYRQGNYIDAFDFYKRALDIALKISDSATIAKSYNVLGLLYYDISNFELSKEFILKSLSFYVKNNDSLNITRLIGNLSLAYMRLGELDSAQTILFNTLNNYQNVFDSLTLASYFDNIGMLYEHRGKLDSAILYHKRSYQIYGKTESQRGLSLQLISIGRCLIAQGKYKAAISYLKRGLKVAENLSDPQLLAQAWKYMSKCYEKLGNYELALKFNRKYIAYIDENFTPEIIKRISQLNTLLLQKERDSKNKLLEAELSFKEAKEKKNRLINKLYTLIGIILIITLFIILFLAIKWKEGKKKVEETNAKLARFNSDLDLMVRYRTMELNEALDKNRELERLKSAFLANISHEIRTPLNGLLGLSYYLTSSESTLDERLELGKQVKRLGDKLLSVVDDVLELSKIETNQLNILLSEVNLNDLFNEVSQEFLDNEEIKKKQLYFKVVKSLPDDKANIITDRYRLNSILVHLIENAFKFTHQGGIELSYSMNENSTITFYVKDTGVGIPADMQNRIFERFFKHVGDDSKVFYEGIGIGLTIAMGYAMALGGNIKVKSSPGKGSTFITTIPVNFTDSDKKVEVDFSKRKILVVEDDLISYQYIEALLTKTGARVLHVKNADDAIEVASIDKNIDLILLDIHLPFRSGVDVAYELKKMNIDIPIIAQTALDSMSDEIKSLKKIGCTQFLNKPIDPDELLNLLRENFEKKNPNSGS